MCLRVYVLVRVYVRACVCVCGCARAFVDVHARVFLCVLSRRNAIPYAVGIAAYGCVNHGGGSRGTNRQGPGGGKHMQLATREVAHNENS